MKSKILVLAFFFIAQIGNLFCNEIYVKVSADKETRRQYIFINDFISSDKKDQRPASIKSIISHDLKFDDKLKIEDSDAINKNLLANKNNLDTWLKENIDYAIEGTFDVTSNILKVKVMYIAQNEKFFEKDYNLTDKNLRKLSHSISNDIYFVLTGYKGLFLTQFVFSYSQGLSGTVKELYCMDYDGSEAMKITSNNSISILPSWNPKSRQLLYTSYHLGNPDLFLYDFNAKDTKAISKKQGLNATAEFSPSGDKIAMSMTIAGSPDIVLIDTAGNQLTRITKNKFIDISPTWSNDGSKIAYISDRTGVPQIYVYDLITKDEVPITYNTKYKDSLQWSPNDEEIVFACMLDKQWDICKINVNSKNITRLTENSGNNEDPSWSPDGRYISFTSTRNGKKELFVMKKDGSNAKKIFSTKGTISSVRWSPFYE